MKMLPVFERRLPAEEELCNPATQVVNIVYEKHHG